MPCAGYTLADRVMLQHKEKKSCAKLGRIRDYFTVDAIKWLKEEMNISSPPPDPAGGVFSAGFFFWQFWQDAFVLPLCKAR